MAVVELTERRKPFGRPNDQKRFCSFVKQSNSSEGLRINLKNTAILYSAAVYLYPPLHAPLPRHPCSVA